MTQAADLEPANPAAGAAYSTTVPAGEVWRFHTIRVRLDTSATAVTRALRVVNTAPSTRIRWQITHGVGQGASLARTYSFQAGGVFFPSSVGSDTDLLVGFGECYGFAGDVISISAINLQAGDQISGIMICVEKATTAGVGHPDWASWWEGGVP